MSEQTPAPEAPPDDARAPLSAELFDHIRDAILVYKLDGTVHGYNLRLAALFQPQPALTEQLRLQPGASAHPLPPLLEVWPALLRGEPRSAQFGLRNAAGQPLDLELFGRRLERPDEDLILIELRDINASKRAHRALLDSKKQLESAVLVRTRELQQKLALIEQQRQTLLELSNPVIQVWDGILVLPLIGTIDRERSVQLTENLLASITRTRSRQVIIDITGVPAIEEDGAAALLRAVRAVELLGAACSLAGISPAVAKSLALGQSWADNLRTFGNLQAALLSAISHRSPTRAPKSG